jgi:hypothetical protein
MSEKCILFHFMLTVTVVLFVVHFPAIWAQVIGCTRFLTEKRLQNSARFEYILAFDIAEAGNGICPLKCKLGDLERERHGSRTNGGV